MIKAFVIRKPGDAFSEKLSEECIASAKNFEIRVEKFDGVYNNHDALLKEKNLFPFKKIKEEKLKKPGFKGCFLSHYLLWEKCVDLNQPLIIFEHDALMIRPLPNNILDLFTHHCILDHASFNDNYQDAIDKECELTVTNYPRIYKDNFGVKDLNATHKCGSHAHIVTPLGAKTIIESVKTHGYHAADVAVNQYYTTYITIEPLIARCHPFFCDKQNRKTYSHTMRNEN